MATHSPNGHKPSKKGCPLALLMMPFLLVGILIKRLRA